MELDMRSFFLGLSLAAGLSASVASAEPVAYQPGGFPRDEVSLRELDSQQLRIVRRAGAQCWHSGEGGFSSRGVRSRACVISGTDGAIRTSDNPALMAFHQALPFNARYDEYRPAYYWQRLVAKN
jgi:hypothetical protein